MVYTGSDRSNLYGYQAVVITKRKKYYINSMDIGFKEIKSHFKLSSAYKMEE